MSAALCITSAAFLLAAGIACGLRLPEKTQLALEEGGAADLRTS
jgi:hypothetical protein